MDTQKKTIILTTLSVTFAVLLLIAATGGKKTGSVWSFLKGSNTTTRADYMQSPKDKYNVTHYDNEGNPSENVYKNDYRPSTTFARAYVEPQEEKHALVASTKVIRKKDKLKSAKKRSKTLAKKRKNKDSLSNDFEEEDDFFSDSEESSNPTMGGSIAAGGSVSSTNNAAKKTQEEEEALLNTVEYWEQPIFVEEDFNAVMKLVNSYNIKKVSNNVFYNVVDDMTHDERTNLREFGVFALAATPSSRSFSELAVIKHADLNSEIRSSVGQEVTRYTNAGRVNFVLGALRSSNESEPHVAIEAMNVLSETSRRYFSLGDSSGPNSPNADASTLLALEPRLDSAIQLIQQKYGNSSNPQIRSEAEKTIASISTNISL